MNLLRRRHLVLLALKLTFRTRIPGFVLVHRSALGKCHLPKQPGKKGVRLAVGFWVQGFLWFEARSSARDL